MMDSDAGNASRSMTSCWSRSQATTTTTTKCLASEAAQSKDDESIPTNKEISMCSERNATGGKYQGEQDEDEEDEGKKKL